MKVRIITEKKSKKRGKKKKNCFSHKEYKTMKGKIKCVMRQKGLKKDKASAYVAGGLRKSGHLDEASLPHHQILKKPKIMARAYKKYIPKAEAMMSKEVFLDEIINLAAYTDKFAFIMRMKAWGITDEKDMFEALIENYLIDPFTKGAIDRINAIKRGDVEYETGRPTGFYDLPQIEPQDYDKLVALIDDPELMDEPEDAFRGEMNPDAGQPADKTWKFGD